jgi:exopolyphosphatase/guanosine-5'-triphosphate,3'-diphosphate pyrophosphatase
VNGHRLSRAGVEVLLGKLATLPLTQRRQVRGLEPARADIIVAGGIICLGAMEGLDFTEMTVSDGGLREGVLLDLLRQSAGTPPPETGH